MILEKIESSILKGLGYIIRLEKKNGNKSTVDFGRFIRNSAAVAARELAQQKGISLVAKKLSLSKNINLIERFIKENLTSQVMIVDYATHDESRDKNG